MGVWSLAMSVAVAAIVVNCGPCQGFASGPNSARRSKMANSDTRSSTELRIGDFFGNFKGFWEGDDEKKDRKNGIDPSSEMNEYADEDAPAGTTRIVTIPVRSIKPGGLRLFLMFYLMGAQNTPERNSWRANQPSTDEYVVEMRFHDASGMLTVELLEHEIRIERFGSLPSTSYLMQESVIVEGILDELDQCATDEKVDEENRLLIPEPKEAIERARGTLSFG